MRLFFDMLKKSDAKRLKKYWEAETPTYQYEIRRSLTKPRYWALYRTKTK